MQSIATHRSNVLNAIIICPGYLPTENPTSLDVQASTKRAVHPWQYPHPLPRRTKITFEAVILPWIPETYECDRHSIIPGAPLHNQARVAG